MERLRKRRTQSDYNMAFKLAVVSAGGKRRDDVQAGAGSVWHPGKKYGIEMAEEAWDYGLEEGQYEYAKSKRDTCTEDKEAGEGAIG